MIFADYYKTLLKIIYAAKNVNLKLQPIKCAPRYQQAVVPYLVPGPQTTFSVFLFHRNSTSFSELPLTGRFTSLQNTAQTSPLARRVILILKGVQHGSPRDQTRDVHVLYHAGCKLWWVHCTSHFPITHALFFKLYTETEISVFKFCAYILFRGCKQ